MISLQTPVEELPKIGAAYAKRLKKMGVSTVQDLLFYFPQRYDDFSHIIPISQVKNGATACVQGRIISVEHSKSARKWMDVTTIMVEDETGAIAATWFNQPYLAQSFKEDDMICLAGKVSVNQDGLFFSAPAHEKIYEMAENNDLTHTGRIVPVYPETKGLTSRWLRYIIKPLLLKFYWQMPETLPTDTLQKYKFLPMKEALWQVHFPDSFEAADAAKARFSFEELLVLQLSVLKEKAKLLARQAPACKMDEKLMQQFVNALPFTLTDSQRQCAYQILKDMEKLVPMSRLLEGDVGSGKTVVAAMAALNAVKAGWQVAFMAPTEILAKQHFNGISSLLRQFGVSAAFLTGKGSELSVDGKTGEIKKKALLEKLESGEIHVLIGTHALISKGVKFKNLALVVLDEQHRFGVSQRSALTGRNGKIPHLLSMTATPIPRTLALTIYGDLDLSLIKEMPKNRKQIKTIVVEPSQRKQAYSFIESEIKKHHGAFVICPKIESADKKQDTRSSNQTYGSFAPQNYDMGLEVPEIKSVEQEYERLSKEVFPDFNVTMMHGKMKPAEKERIMKDFKNGEIDVLVSTSVVEVGVDVPRATVMMIEGAERFGLAQLHQFRGRVGRSDLQSYCFLFTTSPDQLNRQRLKAMVTMHSGFELAQKDLEIRGPGQLYGTQQWGLPDMAMEGLGNIFLVEKTRSAAKELLENDPELKNHPLLAERVERLKTRAHFE